LLEVYNLYGKILQITLHECKTRYRESGVIMSFVCRAGQFVKPSSVSITAAWTASEKSTPDDLGGIVRGCTEQRVIPPLQLHMDLCTVQRASHGLPSRA